MANIIPSAIEVGITVNAHVGIEGMIDAVEAANYIVIERGDLEAHYDELRGMADRNSGRAGLIEAIDFIFEALGEPGTGE
jgi:hypothetical protein